MRKNIHSYILLIDLINGSVLEKKQQEMMNFAVGLFSGQLVSEMK